MSVLGLTILLAARCAAGFFLLVTIARNTEVCPPSEVLIFSAGRANCTTSGPHDRTEVGFRIVRGGRAVRIPLIETVNRMTLTNMAIELSVTNAFRAAASR